ncbi:hypothetical protein HGRIS_007988 [Hohenbuehelia grisea]|uniref:F-box domain-containing protein n=1 Tax=Hohenbuehelia grisea TaxID=104357 RepID=A0ABR3J6J8_9AGAR
MNALLGEIMDTAPGPDAIVVSDSSINYIDTLPLEVLLLLFKQVTTQHPGADDPYTITLSHVCARWRRAVEDAPELWSTLFITPLHDSPSVTRHYLINSKSLTLDIILDLRNGFFDYISPDIVDSLVENSWRWRRFSLVTPVIDTCLPLYKALSAPCLEELNITVNESMIWLLGHIPSPQPIPATMPSLRTLRLDSFGSPIAFSLSHITTLELDSFRSNASILRAILSASPELGTLIMLDFHADLTNSMSEISTAPIHASRLTRLATAFSPAHTTLLCPCGLSLIQAPLLQHLELQFDLIKDVQGHLSFDTGNRYGNVRFLQLQGLPPVVGIPNRAFPLDAFPSLEYLRLDEMATFMELASYFSSSDQTRRCGELSKKLKYIEFESHYPNDARQFFNNLGEPYCNIPLTVYLPRLPWIAEEIERNSIDLGPSLLVKLAPSTSSSLIRERTAAQASHWLDSDSDSLGELSDAREEASEWVYESWEDGDDDGEYEEYDEYDDDFHYD